MAGTSNNDEAALPMKLWTILKNIHDGGHLGHEIVSEIGHTIDLGSFFMS